MATDYERICNENRRKYGTETTHIEHILGRLYSNRTHFLYELLQNAEDAGATRVAFRLFGDRVEFLHDGREFDERDVRGLCGVCVGTKANDWKQIGKFGIGFKSVYAYTTTPEIHSGDQHFSIVKFTQPHGIKPRVDLCPPWTTLQIFPFNGTGVEPKRAREVIDQALRNLGKRTLIFLKNIRELFWEVENRESGTVRCKSTPMPNNPARRVKVSEDRGNQSDAEEWLIFHRPVDVPPELAGSEARHETVVVEVAYQLSQGENGEPVVRRAQGTELFVFFRTQKETHLGFLIQAPYRTTPARDNIREDDEWNELLITRTAELVGDTLTALKRKGLLTIEVLEAMPICPEDFLEGDVFRAIFDYVRETLFEHALIPSTKREFIAGSHAKLCSTPDLRRLLTPTILRDLFRTETELDWVEGELSPDLHRYMVQELGIAVVTPETLAQKFDETFVARRTDAWVARFYAFLDGRKKLWEKGKLFAPALRTKPFIRLRDRSHVEPFDADGYPMACLPGQFQTDGIPIVKPEVFENNKRALDFLKNLGLSVPDMVDQVLSRVLPKYEKGRARTTPKQHARDLEIINLALKTDSLEKKRRLVETLWETPFLRAVNAVTGKRRFMCPGKVYERVEDLEHYFEGNNAAWFLDEELPSEPDVLFAEAAMDEVDVISSPAGFSGNVRLPVDQKGRHRRGIDGFDPDLNVDGLEFALGKISPRKAAFIWNKILIPHQAQVTGEVDFSKSAYFHEAKREGTFSNMGRLVTTMAWLPSRSSPESFHRPSDLMLEDLPDEFVPNRELANALGMKPSGIVEFASTNDIDPACLGLFLRECRADPTQLRDFLEKREKQRKQSIPETGSGNDYPEVLVDSFNRRGGINTEPDDHPPANPVHDPSRFLEELAKNLKGRRTEAMVQRESDEWAPRRIASTKDPNTRAVLKAEYDGRCQICNETFSKRSGQPYFEALYLVSLKRFGWVEDAGNVICLCASCSAKFRYGSVEAEDVLGQIQALRLQAEGGTGNLAIDIKLCGKPVKIRFIEKHALRLRAMIGIALIQKG